MFNRRFASILPRTFANVADQRRKELELKYGNKLFLKMKEYATSLSNFYLASFSLPWAEKECPASPSYEPKLRKHKIPATAWNKPPVMLLNLRYLNLVSSRRHHRVQPLSRSVNEYLFWV